MILDQLFALKVNVQGCNTMTCTMMTPPRSNSPPVCPDAPARKPTPTLFARHCDLGILPGDFVKPDPSMTQRETRAYLKDELLRWLTGDICDHAEEIHTANKESHTIDLVSYLSGAWPAARLYVLFRLLEKRPELQPHIKGPEAFYHVGLWAAHVCTEYLEGDDNENFQYDPARQLAAGFVTTDEMSCGHTIEQFWNHSPFDALRDAPPLIDVEFSDPPPYVIFFVALCITFILPLIVAALLVV